VLDDVAGNDKLAKLSCRCQIYAQPASITMGRHDCSHNRLHVRRSMSDSRFPPTRVAVSAGRSRSHTGCHRSVKGLLVMYDVWQISSTCPSLKRSTRRSACYNAPAWRNNGPPFVRVGKLSRLKKERRERHERQGLGGMLKRPRNARVENSWRAFLPQEAAVFRPRRRDLNSDRSA
jgi:hypothetical protein